ncbi:MAG: 2-oxo acid dehydrogenase subunit E2 [Clostridiales bacterium]|nr:2-oxo acid dehydrogenase subunit E2 [Clostridiales bacterium]
MSYETDATALMAEIKKLNADRDAEHKITYNTAMLKIIAEAVKEAPEMNSHIHFNEKLVAGTIKQFDNIDISVPMILPSGQMMTVTMFDIGNKKIDEITDYIADVRRRMENTNLSQTMYEVSIENTMNYLKKGKPVKVALRLLGAFTGKGKITTLHGKEKKNYDAIPRSVRLTKDDLRQGTLTVSNIGSVYRNGKVKTNLINCVKPQVCAVCLDSLFDKQELKKDENGNIDIVNKKYLSMCVSFDHRVIDYDMIVPFFKKLDEVTADPSILEQWV